MWENVRCVVLNSSYEPLSIVPAKRALILCFEGKASIIEEHPNLFVRSVRNVWAVPTQVVLKHFVKARPTFRVPAQLTQRNLFIRDKYTCQYCSRHKSQLKEHEFLTRDHIIPQARGGRDVWENVVTACSSCNNKKADFILEDTNLKLQKKPSVPTIFEIWSKASSKNLIQQ